MQFKPRTTRYSPFEVSEMLPWSLQNIDVYRTTEPKDGPRDESFLTNHADDISVLTYEAQGISAPWTGTTRFELVLPPDIFKENGRNYVWVRPNVKLNTRKHHVDLIVYPSAGSLWDNTNKQKKMPGGKYAKQR